VCSSFWQFRRLSDRSTPRMSIQSALIGFLISRTLPTPLTPQEIIVVQTTAVATGTMPLAAGFVGILPALTLLSVERDGSPPIHLSWLAAVGWSCSVAFFGCAVTFLCSRYGTNNPTESSSHLPYVNKWYDDVLEYKLYPTPFFSIDCGRATTFPLGNCNSPPHLRSPSITSPRHKPKASKWLSSRRRRRGQ
jgi:hypothetical protein